MTALSINVNKFALIRNARGADIPNLHLFVDMASALAKRGDLKKGLIDHGLIPNCKTNIFNH